MEASRAGDLPIVPERPPHLLVQPTARALFHRFVALAVGGMAAIFAVVALLRVLDVPDSPNALVLGGISLGYLVLLLRTLPAVGRQSVAELQHGYTTLVLQVGGF